ncbi:MAG: NADPH:quinone oxidoreductase family protein [Pseudomonadales bacterium]|nr:NADPH:quinone oxidoreductase [Gammaproteobacteria bacterium]MDP6186128.1 NADPH:quinone oxidoreductase family protein [Pseudomonadales bacterium]RPG31254.1 MAG: NADPH:quinone oxidoreductase family protein [Gammaproteobacteria bacterium TMED243]
MKAVLCEAFGPAENLALAEVASPELKPGHVIVDIQSCALNFPDVLMVEGKYQSLPPFPFTPGGEFAGTVSQVAPDVSQWQVGDGVFAACGHGAMAEQISVAASALRAKPQGMSFAKASGISTTYGTSYYALKQRADLQPGETLLVLGAAGGVGLAAVELGKAMGARVIAAASSPEKLEVARQAGADDLIDYSDGELKEKVKALTEGRGADVIYDPVGGPLFDQCMRCINWNGRVLVVGFVGGDIPKVPTNLVLLKNCQVVGVFYGAFSARFPADNEQNFAELIEMFAVGKLHAVVGAEYPLTDYVEALNCLSQRRAVGKIVVNI